jgi:cell cycle arrest protein BUB3
VLPLKQPKKNDLPSEAKKYAFKCHRVGNTVFPVNALAFHPVHGTFATGGCDGFVNIWDAKNKKRLCQLPSFPTSVAAVDFNHDGSLLAVAASYTFEEGEKDHPPDQVYVRAISDADVKPKPRQAQ